MDVLIKLRLHRLPILLIDCGSKSSRFPRIASTLPPLPLQAKNENGSIGNMRAFTRLLMATPSTMGSKSSLSEAVALLPPLHLYRRILRVHRNKLDPEMRILGDLYVKAEFRAHREVDNPVHIIGFLTEWQFYAQKLEGDAWAGDKLDKAKIEKMSDQQLGQLYELMQTIKNNNEGDGENQ